MRGGRALAELGPPCHARDVWSQVAPGVRPLRPASPTLALDMQKALNALSSVGSSSVGGLVTVKQELNVFTVTFGGRLLGTVVPVMICAAVTPLSGVALQVGIVSPLSTI